MEKEKYFTPDIEDIHIGYKCELINIENAIWTTYIIKENENFKNFMDDISLKDNIKIQHIRVPYLTKEQVEAEGWEFIKKHPGTESCDFEKNKYSLCVDFDFNDKIYLRIYNGEQDNEINYFSGNCKDINTFRRIIKLLKIE